jgi:hypothetical protein
MNSGMIFGPDSNYILIDVGRHNVETGDLDEVLKLVLGWYVRKYGMSVGIGRINKILTDFEKEEDIDLALVHAIQSKYTFKYDGSIEDLCQLVDAQINIAKDMGLTEALEKLVPKDKQKAVAELYHLWHSGKVKK